MKFQTKAIHGGRQDDTGKGAVNYPIYLSSTFVQEDMDNFGEFVYTRGNNPTRAAVEQLAAEVEEAKYGLALATGMAATSLVFSLLKQGDKVLINSNVYGGTWRYVSNLFENRGIGYEIVEDFNTYDFTRVPSDVKAVFLETPSNPLLEVTDIRAVSEAAKKQGILVIVDNTFMTAYFQKPLNLGADIVVYSATKYYAGHSDILAGLVVLNDDELYRKLKFLQNTLGSVLSPFDSFLLIRGIKTLGLRLEQHQRNAITIADYLKGHGAVEKVFYPGVGGMVSFLFRKDAYDMNLFVKNLDLFGFAVSLGGVESLICRPATMTHESYPKELREQIGITDHLLRLAIGIEDVEDLLADLEQAFNKSKK